MLPPNRLPRAGTARVGSLPIFVCICILWAPSTLLAQSTTTGSVAGSVRTASFQPVGQALVSLTPIGSGNAYTVNTTTTGSFTVYLVQPGSYVVRVEALGYRPLVARVLTVSGGERQSLSLTLTEARPPVVQVDTLMLGPASSTRWRAGAIQFGGMETEGLPYRFDDLASITALSRSALSGVSAIHTVTDAEWSGAPGGYVGLSTRTSTPAGGMEADASYSGNPLWSSSELDIDKPSLLSLQGGVRGTVPIDQASRLILSAEALTQQTPLAPRASESLASELTSLDPALVSSLTDPGVERYERYSGLIRYDLQQGTSSQFFLRGASAFSRRRFDGAGALSIAGPSALGARGGVDRVLDGDGTRQPLLPHDHHGVSRGLFGQLPRLRLLVHGRAAGLSRRSRRLAGRRPLLPRVVGPYRLRRHSGDSVDTRRRECDAQVRRPDSCLEPRDESSSAYTVGLPVLGCRRTAGGIGLRLHDVRSGALLRNAGVRPVRSV